MIDRLRRRLSRAFNRKEFERQLDEELRFHVESEEAELLRAGLPPAEARRRALASFGRFDRWRDEARETRLGSRLESLARDLRLSLRSLRRSPSYTVPAIATLALGIAALATISTLAYDVLFRALPYNDPARLVAVFERNIPRKRDRNVVSAAAFTAWRERSRTMDSVSALMPASRVWITDAGPERVSGAEVSPSLFPLLGKRPALGPGFSAPTVADEVIISHGFWTRRLGADASVIGKRIMFGGAPATVVGVMPSDFTPLRFGWMGEQEFWSPFTITQQHSQWGRFLLVAARLRPGATLDAAGRELHDIHSQLQTEGSIAQGWDAHMIPLPEEMSGSVRQPFYALLVACALLLVMVLTNTTLLTIAHTRRRAGDRALRAVLGATGGRLLAERLATTLVLAAGAGALGIAVSAWAIPALTRFLPSDVPRLESVHFGGVALVVGTLTALLAALVLVAVPAFDQRGGGDMSASLQGGARMTRSARTAWVVIGETAAAVVLTLFAGLTLRSFDRLASVDIGFDPARLVAFRVAFEGPGVDPAAAAARSGAFLEQLRALPGVVSVTRTSVRPFNSGGTATTVTPPGLGDRDRSAYPTADVRYVDAEYFRTLGLAPLSGRLFSAAEKGAGPMRVVVNETFGKKLWPGEGNVVGRPFDLRVGGGPEAEVIGVVHDVRLSNLRGEQRPTVYVFTEQRSAGEEFDVLVRTAGDEAVVLPELRRVAQSVAAGTPIFRVERMQQTVSASIARERVTAQLLAFFAVSALLLVAVGIYGLYAGEVTRRRREIGVRMALGETSAGVIGDMLGRALARTAVGVAVGVGVGLFASSVLTSVLFGVAKTDPLSYVAAIAVVVLAALGATLIPAVQASGVQPSLALRAE